MFMRLGITFILYVCFVCVISCKSYPKNEAIGTDNPAVLDMGTVKNKEVISRNENAGLTADVYKNGNCNKIWILSNGRYVQQLYTQNMEQLPYHERMNTATYDVITCSVKGLPLMIVHESRGTWSRVGNTYYFSPLSDEQYIVAGTDDKDRKYMTLNAYGNLEHLREDFEKVVLKLESSKCSECISDNFKDDKKWKISKVNSPVIENTSQDEDSDYLDRDVVTDLKKDLKIGSEYQGGIIIFLDDAGVHGLLMSKENLFSTGGTWYDAVEACQKYRSGGYRGWRLPTIEELRIIREHKELSSNFVNNWYWSSTEDKDNSNNAYHLGFEYGDEMSVPKEHGKYIRAVREF
jgi:hypothetical protein